MKCPSCGHDMQEGHLICEECGYEIRIVPDFDPNLDADIHLTSIDDTTYKTDEFTNDIKAGIKRRFWTIGFILLGSIILIGIAIASLLRINSYDYQLNRARTLASQNKYEEAISLLENLYVTHSDDSQILFMEADYYQKLDKDDIAEDTLMRVINNSTFTQNDILSAYDRIISLLETQQDYSGINSLLETCEYTQVTNAYQNYMAMPPVFSFDSGEYDKAIRLKLSANTSGTIYITMDGSVPNESSKKYESSILLDHGEYTISAMFVNQYGIKSETKVNAYSIMSELPVNPEINYDSGNYTEPSLITAQFPEDCKVYYTTDKSIPTVDSTMYTDPIPMPINYSNFTFITINDQGITSEPVVRSYHLSFKEGLSPSNAIQTLKDRLIERGLINDYYGLSDRAPGRYTYEVISAIPIKGQGDYYTIREFYHDGTGDVTPTDTTYIVEIYQGSTALLGGDAVNGFLAISF